MSRLGTVTAVVSRTDPRGDYVEIRWDASILGNRFCRREDRIVVGERVEAEGEKPPRRSLDLFECDNGRLLCRAHLGSSAALTGRDISGLPIVRLSNEALDRTRAEVGADLAHLVGCETCLSLNRNRRTP